MNTYSKNSKKLALSSKQLSPIKKDDMKALT